MVQERVTKELEQWLDDLYREVALVAETHWALVRQEEKQQPNWENKSQLRLKFRRRGNALEVTWEKVRWVGSKKKGTRTAITERIPNGRDVGDLRMLTRLSRDWEKPLVEDTIAKLRVIKKQWGHINKALQQIRLARAVLERKAG